MANDISFIRELIDFIDQKLSEREAEQPAQEEHTVFVSPMPTDAGAETPPDDSQAGVNPMERDDIFVPPLQAKIEIMKKLSGIPLKDETLAQSQEQGGPAKEEPEMSVSATSPAEELKKQLTMSELFGDEEAGV